MKNSKQDPMCELGNASAFTDHILVWSVLFEKSGKEIASTDVNDL